MDFALPQYSRLAAEEVNSSINQHDSKRKRLALGCGGIAAMLIVAAIVAVFHAQSNKDSTSTSSLQTTSISPHTISLQPPTRVIHDDFADDEQPNFARTTPTDHGLLIHMSDGHSVELAVSGVLGFRVSVSYDGKNASALESRMIDSHTDFAEFKMINEGSFVGLATSFGSILIDPTTGAFSFKNADGVNITQSDQLTSSDSGVYSANTKISLLQHNDTCAHIFPGTDQSGGRRTPSHPNGIPNSNRASCCAACNSDSDCSFWVLDPNGKVCWLLMDVQERVPSGNRDSGGFVPPSNTIQFQLDRNDDARFYGAGGGAGASMTSKSSNPYVTNTAFQIPYYYSSEGYAALAVSSADFARNSINSYPASWSQSGDSTTWTLKGSSARADLYLWPASTPAAAIAGFWELTGKPRKLPRYAYGFLACRWGWENRAYIENILGEFRSGKYPIDAFISDFEWFSNTPDYNLPSQGSTSFVDFSYNPVTFPAPVEQLTLYHNQYHVRFGGIRKPRLGNSELISMANSKGWLLKSVPRNFNYSIPEVRDYYASQIAHFLPDGVDFWWNDEGETQYFTFHDWNRAQLQALTAYNPTKRFFTINRSYTPGMSRMGLVIWTGDISVSYQSLEQTAQYLLNWGMSGVAYVTCDIGGFNGPDSPSDLLVRWYQVGTFLGIFRVHSTLNDKPHFPFLYDATSAALMKAALDWRYQLVPHIYSLAHNQYEKSEPIIRSMFHEFPTDEETFDLQSQWMVGREILAAPVLTQDQNKQVYLPAATWFEYGTATTHAGPTTLSLSNLPLSSVPVYVRAGSILALAPKGLQYTDQLPGGALQMVVYAGADATFTLIEDDGATSAYETASVTNVRRTTFVWSDSSRTLSWSVPANSFSDSHTFINVVATAYFPDGTTRNQPQQVLGSQGTFQF